MSNDISERSSVPELLTLQVEGLIGRAAQLAPEDLVLRDKQGRRDELVVGEGYLESVRRPGGKIASMGVSVSPSESVGDQEIPARTVIKKSTRLGFLIVAAQGDDTQPIEGSFDQRRTGEPSKELDEEASVTAALGVLSAIEREIAKRERVAAKRVADGIRTLIRS